MDLSRYPGRCRFNTSGMGWRPVDGEMRMLVNSEIASAQWSRAAKGYEVKIVTRTMGIVQLDGFEQDVCIPLPRRSCGALIAVRLLIIASVKSGFRSCQVGSKSLLQGQYRASRTRP